jgi:cyclophilin family peptidyl-prolyl cis-trans isomerase
MFERLLGGLLCRAEDVGSMGRVSCDALEQRCMLAVNVVSPIPNLLLGQGDQPSLINLVGRYDNPELNGTIVRFNTSMGTFNALLYDQLSPGALRTTPATVANFLRYITEDRYDNTIIHRSLPGFVVQAGGFTLPNANDQSPTPVPTFTPVVNEPGNSNVRGTLAMAKLPNNPNSATSQWFVNVGNNSANLDGQNGGFTVFGRIIGNGMQVVDAIAGLPVFNASTHYNNSTFSDLPLRNFTQTPVLPENFVSINVEAIPEMSFSVTSSNPDLVGAVIEGGNLRLNPSQTLGGIATVTVRATSADGSFVDNAFAVRIVRAPSIAGVATSPEPVGRNSNMEFVGTGVVTPDAKIRRAEFFLDTNGNGQFDPLTDKRIASTSSLKDGEMKAKFRTRGLPLGESRVFMVVTDVLGQTSNVVSTTFTVVNAEPTVKSVKASTKIVKNVGDMVNLSVSGARDVDGRIERVQYFLDTGNEEGGPNGVFDEGDRLLGEVTTSRGGFRLPFSTEGLAPGEVRIFARVIDTDGAASQPVTHVFRINSPPVLTGFTVAPIEGAKNLSFLLTGISGGDIDGTVRKMEFWLDRDGNGLIDRRADRSLGSGKLGPDGYTLTLRGSRLAAGDNQIIARAVDNNGGFSEVRLVLVTV